MLRSSTLCSRFTFLNQSRASQRFVPSSQIKIRPNRIRPLNPSRMVDIHQVPINVQSSNRKTSQRKIEGDSGETKTLNPSESQNLLILCGIGYFVQGFRCFPWLALNYHMVHHLNMNPSTLQVIQHTGNLPMIFKPLLGLISDAVYINNSHRIPYILIGVLLQIFSWSPLSFPPFSDTLPFLITLILLSNTGASIVEAANDALIAEFGRAKKIGSLQSYALMASAIGGILGNLLGGYFLATVNPKTMFTIFSILLSYQLVTSSRVNEETLGLTRSTPSHARSLPYNVKKQLRNLKTALSDEALISPILWAVGSIAMVPVQTGVVFCYQTETLGLDPWVIGLSRVCSQMVLLVTTMIYDRHLVRVPVRRVVVGAQVAYACCLLVDLVVVKRGNVAMGVPDAVFVGLFGGLAEAAAQFKVLPVAALVARVCPAGCEGSVTSFMAAAICAATVVGGLLGVGLGAAAGSLPVAICVQFGAALVPLLGVYAAKWDTNSLSYNTAKRRD